jgi:hypothetical protein
MRTGYLQRYTAGNAPQDYDPQFLRQELQRIQDALAVIADGQLDFTTVTPPKPRDGAIRYGKAGVLGVGEGFYGYYAAAWHLLG